MITVTCWNYYFGLLYSLSHTSIQWPTLLTTCSWFQGSATKRIRTELFSVSTQQVAVIPCRCFGTAWSVPKCRYGITTNCRIITQTVRSSLYLTTCCLQVPPPPFYILTGTWWWLSFKTKHAARSKVKILSELEVVINGLLCMYNFCTSQQGVQP